MSLAETPVAVIGMSLRFPGGVTNTEDFWKMLIEGRNVSTEVPDDRYNVKAFYHPDPARTDSLRVRKAHFINGDINDFDAPFFNMSASEAAFLDPQQRGVLEGAYHALENAGITMKEIAGSDTSVYSASFSREHESLFATDPSFTSPYQATGTGSSMLANRVSHFFNLSGPSLAVDTACSSGLYAMHLACQSLIQQETGLSIVAGANIILSPDAMSLTLTNGGFLSNDGRCYSFDARANGYARGEGFGTVILKRLDDAVRDRNTIRAVIRGSLLNQDGRTPSITQPSGSAQVALIQETYRRAKLDYTRTALVEAHGTGTFVGDPIEANAIGNAFKSGRDKNDHPLYIGAVKSNIGHLEGASGLAGFIKAVLVLEKGIIPPNADFQTVNPAIDLTELNVQVPTRSIPWPKQGLRRVSVNSFGYGGSNAHIILDDALHFLEEHGLEGEHNTFSSAACDVDGNAICNITIHHRSGSVDALNGHSNDINDISNNKGADVGSNGTTRSNEASGPNNTTVAGVTRSLGEAFPADLTYEKQHSVNNEAFSAIVQKKNIPLSTNDNKILNGFCGHDTAADSHSTVIDASEQQASFNSLLLLSAADEEGVQRQAIALQGYAASLSQAQQNDNHLQDIAFTLSNARNSLRWKSFIIANSVSQLATSSAAELPEPVRHNLQPEMFFVFTGQGSHVAGMGHQLLKYAGFRASLLACDQYLRYLGCSWSVLNELQLPAEQSRLSSPELSQPLCTAIQVALVDLLREWGLQPQAVCGHSSGEIAAAYCASLISKQYAWRASYYRGIVSEKLARDKSRPESSMLSVGLDEKEAQKLIQTHGLHDSVCVACINSPINVTLSGQKVALNELYNKLDHDQIFVRKLDVNVAYHSSLMRAAAAEYETMLGQDEHGNLATSEHDSQVVAVTFISSVDGRRVTDAALRTPKYWIQNLVSPVKFLDAVNALISIGSRSRPGQAQKSLPLFVEIGPQAGLRRPIQDTCTSVMGKNKWKYLPTLQSKNDADIAILKLIGSLWSYGIDLNVLAVNQHAVEHRQPLLLQQLPPYQFNHSNKYWMESRLSQQYRGREHRRHGLLGLRNLDFNVGEASWRHWIRVQENSWILDHTLNGSPIYPGSGMLVMAVEAARQLSDNHEHITGYRLKNVRFLRAIHVSNSDRGSEARIDFRPRRDATNALHSWHDWRIYALHQDVWGEVAYGSIKVDYKDEENAQSVARQEQSRRQLRDQYEHIESTAAYNVSNEQFYDNMTELGFNYGPSFRHLTDIAFDKAGNASGNVLQYAWAKGQKYYQEDPSVIHPATLDTICHLPFANLSHGGYKPTPTMMFTHVGDFWISQELLHNGPDAVLEACAMETLRGLREAEHTVLVFSKHTKNLVIQGERVRGTSITSIETSPAEDNETSRMCYETRQEPALDLLDNASIQAFFDDRFADLEPPNKEVIDKADSLAMYYMTDLLSRITLQNQSLITGHLQQYVDWIRRAVTEKSEIMSDNYPKETIELMLSDNGLEAPAHRMVRKIGEALEDVLFRGVSPVQIMFEDELVQEYYHSQLFLASVNKLADYVDVLAHANPEIKILEIGAGTGAATKNILTRLAVAVNDKVNVVRFAEYVYSDISTQFFEHARERYAPIDRHMQFSRLDIEQDPLSQGFQPQHYDIVLAGNVLHATSDLKLALENIKKVLKPGGRLIFTETCNTSTVRDNFVFGILPGWRHASEPERTNSPLLDEKQWGEYLTQSSFSGIDQLWRDHESRPYHSLTVCVSTLLADKSAEVTLEQQVTGFAQETYILLEPQSAAQNKLAELLRTQLSSSNVRTVSIQEIEQHSVKDNLVITLLELDSHVWTTIEAPIWAILKTILLSAKKILWVTAALADGVPHPENHIITGLARTLCTERAEQCVLPIHLHDVLDMGSVAQHVVDVLFKSIKEHGTWHDAEYTEVDGRLGIGRIVPRADLNRQVASRVQQHAVLDYKIGQAEPKDLTLTIEAPGLFETLMFRENANGFAPLEEKEIEIQIRASCLNFKDIMIALGQVVGDGFGFEGAGIVSRSRSSNFRPGQRVMFFASKSSFGSYIRVSELQAHIMPEDMDYNTAATIPVIFGTTLYALKYLAHVRAGESILIHSAAGGVGQAAIMLSQLWGLDIYVTTSNEEKKSLLRSEYGIPVDRIFSSRDISFADDVMSATSGRGVDVVLNSLAGDLLHRSWDCVASLGRFIEVGKRDIIINNSLSMRPFERNTTFASVDMSVLIDQALPRVQSLLAEMMQLWAAHAKLHAPRPMHTYSCSDIESAMRYMQSGKSVGKIVIEFNDDTLIKYRPALKPNYMFPSDATYIIAGGLGGLGRSIVRWMVTRGARYFLLLSRSGGNDNKDAEKFIGEITTKGGLIWAPSCDISNRNLLERIVNESASRLPPIRGCIQSAMVLHDIPLEQMDCDMFHKALDPKVVGTMNLHECLPDNLDFFIMMASMTGIVGPYGQSNYAAGNTFEDALARYRIATGQNAVSLDLPMLLEVGWAAQDHNLIQALRRAGFESLRHEHFLALLDTVCDPQYDCKKSIGANIINFPDSPQTLHVKFKESPVLWMNKPLFANLRRLAATSGNVDGSGGIVQAEQVDYLALIKDTANEDEAAELLASGLVKKLARSLSIPEDDIDTSKAPYMLGVDSLIAVEVRYWFMKEVKAEVAVFNILKDESVLELCKTVVKQVTTPSGTSKDAGSEVNGTA